jgi:hypothetical protein
MKISCGENIGIMIDENKELMMFGQIKQYNDCKYNKIIIIMNRLKLIIKY